MKNVLYMIPSGGLANRMRAIVSGYWLAGQTGSRLQIIWFRDWALNAPFHELFMPLNEEKIPLREAHSLIISFTIGHDVRTSGYHRYHKN